jgi:hypothetical protein
MRIRLALIIACLAIVLTGCSPTVVDEAPPPVPEETTINRAVAFVNKVDAFTEQTETGAPGLALDTLDSIDATLENFGKSAVSEQMPDFYAAAVAWRDALDKALEADSGVMTDRALDDLADAKTVMRAELEAVLDAAGM